MTEHDDSGGFFSAVDPYVRGAGRTAIRKVPRLEAPLAALRGYYIHAYVSYTQWQFNRRHAAPIDPYRIVRVDPDRIETALEPSPVPRFRRAGDVVEGEWEQGRVPFTDLDVYRAFERRFEGNCSWTDTAFFHRVLSEIDRGREPWGCDSRATLEARCERLDTLYETIAEEGFRTQRELMADDADDPIGSRRISPYGRFINDEIAVNVDRDGELLFVDGRNRLSIAKVLDVDTVPVMVLQRHADWVSFRDSVAEHVERTGTLPAPVDDHPDLRYLPDVLSG